MVKTHTSSRQPTNTRINTVANVLPKERRVRIHIGFPSPKVLHHKDKPPEHDALKASEDFMQESWRAVGNRLYS